MLEFLGDRDRNGNYPLIGILLVKTGSEEKMEG